MDPRHDKGTDPRPRAGRRDLPLLVAAVGVSAVGDFLALVPMALHLEEHASPYALAALFVCLWGPSVFLAGPAGVLVDRAETRRLVVAVSLAQAVVAAAIALAGGSTAVLLAGATALGCLFAVASPAEFALLPAVAAGRDEVRATGVVETARYAGMAAGPVLGAFLAAAGGLEAALLVDAATFLAVAAAAALLHARRPPAVHEAAPCARDGARIVLGDRDLRLVLAVTVTSLLTMTACAAAEVRFFQHDLGAGETGYGLLMATWFGAMGLGALVLASRLPRAALPLAAMVLVALQGTGIALPAVWPALAVAFAACALGGLAQGAKNVAVRTLIADVVPAAFHGRAFAAYNGLRNAAEMGALGLGGVLLATAGAGPTLLVAGGGAVVCAACGLSLRAAARRGPARSRRRPSVVLPEAGR